MPMVFLVLRKLRNICCGHKRFLNKISRKCCARGQTEKHLCRQQCVGNNVSSFARAFMVKPRCHMFMAIEKKVNRPITTKYSREDLLPLDYHKTVHRSPVVIIRAEYIVNLAVNHFFPHCRLRRYKPTKSRLDFIRPLVAISDKPEFI